MKLFCYFLVMVETFQNISSIQVLFCFSYHIDYCGAFEIFQGHLSLVQTCPNYLCDCVFASFES